MAFLHSRITKYNTENSIIMQCSMLPLSYHKVLPTKLSSTVTPTFGQLSNISQMVIKLPNLSRFSTQLITEQLNNCWPKTSVEKSPENAMHWLASAQPARPHWSLRGFPSLGLYASARCTELDRALLRWQWYKFPSCRTSCCSCLRCHKASLHHNQSIN